MNRPAVDPLPPASALTKLTAASSAALLGFSYPLSSGLTTAFLPVLALFGVYLKTLATSAVRSVVAIGLSVVVSGILLVAFVDVNQERNSSNGVFTLLFFSYTLFGVPLLYWCMRVLAARAIIACFSVGMLALGILSSAGSLDFKFTLAVPLTLLVGCLVTSPRVRIPLLIALAFAGIISEARSFAAFVCIALILVWLGRAINALLRGQRKSVVYAAMVTAGCLVGYTVYSIGANLLTSGALGDANQRRSAEQLRQTGDLLTSARPEIFATWGLFKRNPWGFGPGARPDVLDVSAARSELFRAGIPSGGDYYRVYMFGGHFKLHSIISDMWVNFGLVGLVAALLLLIYFIHRIVENSISNEPSFVRLFLYLCAAWYMLFGPLTTNLPFVALALAVAVTPSTLWTAAQHSDHRKMRTSSNRSLSGELVWGSK